MDLLLPLQKCNSLSNTISRSHSAKKIKMKTIIITCIVLQMPFMLAFSQVAWAQNKTASTMDYHAAIDHAYTKFKALKEGKNADYIKELAKVDPNIYGISIVTADGKV